MTQNITKIIAGAAIVAALALGSNAAVAGVTKQTVRIVPSPANNSARSAGDNAASAAIADAQSAITRAILVMRRDFENSPELHDARNAARAATQNYYNTANEVLKPLRETSHYRQANETVLQLEQRLNWGRYDDRLNDRQVAETAKALLSARIAISQMENAVLSVDPRLAEARDAMMDASGKVIALQRQFLESIKTDPTFVAAKARLEAARGSLARNR